MPSKSNFNFFAGPFASASLNAQETASNIYFSLLFQDSITAQLELEKDYELLLKDGDATDIESKRQEISYAESLLGLNILYTMMDEELESSGFSPASISPSLSSMDSRAAAFFDVSRSANTFISSLSSNWGALWSNTKMKLLFTKFN